jgi:hypothetical protein
MSFRSMFFRLFLRLFFPFALTLSAQPFSGMTDSNCGGAQ